MSTFRPTDEPLEEGTPVLLAALSPARKARIIRELQ